MMRIMPRKPAPKRAAPTKTRKRTPDDPKQFERFVEAARKAEVDEDPEALDRAFAKVVTSKGRSFG
jgi:hypothetical protein